MINPINPQDLNINTRNTLNTNNTSQTCKHNSYETNFLGVRNKKIGFKEGVNIFISGIVKQGKETIHAIISHPIKTLAIIGGTTLGLMALPFIGIPTAVGGGILALGFGGYAIGKGVYHAIQFANNNKRGSYHIARKNLEKMGEDTIDIALSVPFAPKAISRVSNFAKYGKIAYNKALVDTLKAEKSVNNKFSALRNFDKNMSRSINYQSAVDKELLKYKDLTEAEKAALKEEILTYNVPKRDLPKVVLEKWAQQRGISAKPDILYTTFPQNIGGYAILKDCSIILNDYKTKIPNNSFSNYQQIGTKLINNEYEITYKNVRTGDIVKDTISKDMIDRYNSLYAQEAKLTPEARQILVTLHEREHIHQYAQIISQKGFSWQPTTDRGKFLYQEMIKDMPKVQPGSVEAQQIEALVEAKNSATPVAYIKNAREVGAREAEWEMLNNPDFKKLDNVFAKTNKMKTPALHETIILNALRPESAAS